MDLVTFRLGTATGTAKGKLKGKLGHAWEATGGNGFGNFRAGDHHWDTLGAERKAEGKAKGKLGGKNLEITLRLGIQILIL